MIIILNILPIVNIIGGHMTLINCAFLQNHSEIRLIIRQLDNDVSRTSPLDNIHVIHYFIPT